MDWWCGKKYLLDRTWSEFSEILGTLTVPKRVKEVSNVVSPNLLDRNGRLSKKNLDLLDKNYIQERMYFS